MHRRRLLMLSLVVSTCLFTYHAANGADEAGKEEDKTLAGHSYHGEYLNEGPRQKAYIIGGTGAVEFEVTSKSDEAKAFVRQGIGALYGFWYLEAERSFRQAISLDKDCAIAYWGASLATKGNSKRAKGFIAEAVKRKGDVSERERMYIEAWDKYLKADPKKKKERAESYVKALESIAIKYPDDIEAKALLALQLYLNKSEGSPIVSYLAVDGLLDKVFAKQPMHSAHHFRIHLWDYKDPKVALPSAARCGQASPSIAHMWHMPGHIFSRLKRYDDAAWQQEASARVDHAHMMRDRVLPDQIHNFAHNNEWLIRNLNHVGRVRDAVDLAKNMIELPRHPKYNHLGKRGSTTYGRMRLFDTLRNYELWTEMIEMCQSPYLEATDQSKEQVKRLRHLGVAYYQVGDTGAGDMVLADVASLLDDETAKRDKAEKAAVESATKKAVNQKLVDKAKQSAQEKAATDKIEDEEAIAKLVKEAEKKSRDSQIAKAKKTIDKAKAEARKKNATTISELTKAVAELEAYQKVGEGNYKEALSLLRKAGRNIPAMEQARIRVLTGEVDKALADAKKEVDRKKHEVQPLACYIELLASAGKMDEAKKQFDVLREVSSSIDMNSPVFTRLNPIAEELGFTDDWRQERETADDIGERPTLDSLGPFRWAPSPAPPWELKDEKEKFHSLADYRGKPVVLIFYLGVGCLHCAEQLHAFAPMDDEYDKAGIEVVAISSDDLEGLKQSIEGYDKGKLPMKLLSNADLSVFKEYRAHDDFEKQPLHGTFLIDADGLVRWQDISYEPFMDAKFLLKESKRLLGQTRMSSSHDDVINQQVRVD